MKMTWSIDKPDIMGRPSGLGLQAPEKRPTATRPARGLARLIPEGIRRRVIEAMGGGTLLGQTGAGDEDLVGYRVLSQRIDSITRDLDAWTYDKQIRMALYLYATNPLAKWLIDNLVDVTMGQRIGFTVEVNAAQAKLSDTEADKLRGEIYEHLSTFWSHPAHSLDTRAREYATTHLLTGALLLPVTFAEVNGKPVDGVPMLDIIDAQQIARVASADRSAMVAGTVFYRGADAGGDAKPLEVIRQRDRKGPLVGQAFYFPLRSLLNQLMGTSYLLDVIDWLDRHDQFMFAALDRAKMGNNYVAHVKMDGLDAVKCEEMAAKLKRTGFGQEPASVVVTNEKGEVNIASPDLKAGDIDVAARVFRTHILGAKSRPESWYSSGGDTNRATAGEQTDVAYKALERWQDHFRGMFETMLFFAYDSGRTAGAEGIRSKWPDRAAGALTISVSMPPIRERDYARIGGAIAAIEGAIHAAVEDGLLSEETGRKLFQNAVSKLGVDIDPNAEYDRIKAEREERAKQDGERANALARAALVAGADREDKAETEDDGAGEPPHPPAAGKKAGPAPKAPEPADASDDSEEAGGIDVRLNGAQIKAAVEIVVAVASGAMPRESGLNQLEILFGLSREQAERLMGPAGTKTPTTPNPVGGASAKAGTGA